MSVAQADAAEALCSGSNHSTAALTLRELRHRRDLSIRTVEARTGINRARLSMIERGRELPTPDQLAVLADVYGVEGRWRFVTLAVLEAVTP